MGDATNVDELRRIAFLQDFPQSHLDELASIARVEDYVARSTIFIEGDPAKDVYLIVSGEVSLVACESGVGCRQLTTLGNGELLGWSPMLGRSRFTATAHTLSPTRTVAINGDALRSLCKQNTDLAYEILRRVAGVLADRLFATRLHLFKMSGPHLPEVVMESD